jgi:simple sugar transport system permease protein
MPAVFLAYVTIAALMHLFLTRTLMGRSLFAVGGDPEAASRVGFDVGHARLIAYGLAGALAGIAGVTHATLNWVGEPRAFDNLTLDVLAAVILGGASIFGGSGSVIGTTIGVFLLVLINNSLIILGIPPQAARRSRAWSNGEYRNRRSDRGYRAGWLGDGGAAR